MNKRHYEYVIQDKYKNGPWEDYNPYRKIADARKQLAFHRNAPEWTDGGNRQWRLVRRCVTETILGD